MKRAIVIAALVLAFTVRGQDAASWWNALAADGAIFDPLTITGCKCWIDASDDKTVLDWGGNQATNNGVVHIITDKSGNSNDATALQYSYEPLKMTGMLNGRNAVYFDGDNDYVEFPVISRFTNTIFVVVVAYPQTKGTVLFKSDALYLFVYDDGDLSINKYHGISTTPILFGNGINMSAQSRDAIYDELVNVPSVITMINVGTEAWTGNFGFSKYGGFEFKGLLCEILWYDRVLSETEYYKVEKYLGSKWGITAAP